MLCSLLRYGPTEEPALRVSLQIVKRVEMVRNGSGSLDHSIYSPTRSNLIDDPSVF